MEVSIINLPGEGSLGPAMKALPTDNMRRFVVALAEIGSIDYAKAAALAGYNQTRGALQVTGHRLAHDERILRALDEESVRRMHAGKIVAVSNLMLLASNPQHKDHLKAIEMILNRTGLHNMSEHKVTVNNTSETDDAMIARIKQLAGGLGLDATKLLGQYGVQDTTALALPTPREMVDVEFTEVGDGVVPVEGTSEGLEDML